MRHFLRALAIAALFSLAACGTDDPEKQSPVADGGAMDQGMQDMSGTDAGTGDSGPGETDMMVAPTCDDGVQNQDESDIDCGGVCDRCETGLVCFDADDCASGRCDNNVCADPLKALGQVCTDGTECESGSCEAFGDTSYCTTTCTDTCDGQNLACFDGQCVPDTYCDDPDGDGLGVGPGCDGSPCETCSVDATCSQDGNTFTCMCNAGFVGDGMTCTDVDECADGTAACDENATCTNTPGSFSCTCDAGFVGDGTMCADIDECAEGSDNCAADASCKNVAGSFECECDAGYTGDGVTCTDIDECAEGTDNCSQNGACTNEPGTFSCACNAGYAGDGVNCTDIDECATGADNCDANATCTNEPGSFSCACDNGYMGDGTTCTDINECTAGSAGCDTNATCANTDGGFTCTCDSGYQGDGFTCADIDECSMIGTCGSNAQCVNLPGGVACVCNSGYEGDATTGCTDIDECSNGDAQCDANATCTNTPGNYSCSCNSGFTGNGTTCSDIDECQLGTDNCDSNAACVNNPGGFSCSCDMGYVGDGTSCELEGDTCDTAINVGSVPFVYSGDTSLATNDYAYQSGDCPGSSFSGGTSAPDLVFDFTPSVSATYQVELAAGFDSVIYVITDCDDAAGSCVQAEDSEFASGNEFLNVPLTAGMNYKVIVDGYSSGQGAVTVTIDLNECLSGQSNCDPVNGQCNNTTSGFTCSCADGYSGNGQSCSDIDECATGADNCDNNATCTNTSGSFTCACNAGYSGDGVTCVDQTTPGETCVNPFMVGSLPFSTSGDTTDANNDFSFPAGACPGVPGTAGGASNDEVYAFVPPADGDYRVVLSNTNFDSVLYIVNDCQNIGSTCVAADDAVSSGGTETIETTFVGGLTYYIVVDGFSNSSDRSGTYDLDVTAVP